MSKAKETIIKDLMRKTKKELCELIYNMLREKHESIQRRIVSLSDHLYK